MTCRSTWLLATLFAAFPLSESAAQQREASKWNGKSNQGFTLLDVAASEQWRADHEVYVMFGKTRYDLPMLIDAQKNPTGLKLVGAREAEDRDVRSSRKVLVGFRKQDLPVVVKPAASIGLSGNGVFLTSAGPISVTWIAPDSERPARTGHRTLDMKLVKKLIASGNVLKHESAPRSPNPDPRPPVPEPTPRSAP